jgi:aspartate/methionine/tyrosine aminotransferase
MLDEAVAALALENADLLLERSIALVRRNLEILDKWVASQPRFSYVKPEAGTIALLYYDFDMSSEDFCRELMRYCGALLTPGSAFEEEGCARIGYACDTRQLESGLEKLGQFALALERGEVKAL